MGQVKGNENKTARVTFSLENKRDLVVTAQLKSLHVKIVKRQSKSSLCYMLLIVKKMLFPVYASKITCEECCILITRASLLLMEDEGKTLWGIRAVILPLAHKHIPHPHCLHNTGVLRLHHFQSKWGHWYSY